MVMVQHKQLAEIGTWQIAKASVCRDSVNAVMRLSCSSDNTICERRSYPDGQMRAHRGLCWLVWPTESNRSQSHNRWLA